MKIVFALIKRNIKLFFKDKAMFLTSLITPVILLVLYATFLGNVYRDSFLAFLPEGLVLSDQVLGGIVGGQLMSSILAVSCVTVAVCSNFLTVQDKANGSIRDFLVSPVHPAHLAVGYYIASFCSTMIICLCAAVICFVYLAFVEWYLAVADVFLILLDIFLLVLFGTALSSIINLFLSTNGQISAFGTIVSSGYGFVSGAYMPISQFSSGLQNVIACLPGTYGTSLMRGHCMQGAISELASLGIPADAIAEIKRSMDCSISFFGHEVSTLGSYGILIGTDLLLIAIYVLLNVYRMKKAKK